MGADAAIRNMRYKDEPTHPFQEHLNTFQPFVGLRLHQYFGIEAGYQQSQKGTKERFFNENEKPMFFGGQALNLNYGVGVGLFNLDMQTSNSVKGWNIGVLGFYPIIKDKTELFGKIGYSNLSLDLEYFLTVNQRDTTVGNIASRSFYHHLHHSTGMLTIGVGIKHAFSNKIGGRFFVNFDRTGRLHVDSNIGIDQQVSDVLGVAPAAVVRGDQVHIKPHHSFSTGVGLYYTWK